MALSNVFAISQMQNNDYQNRLAMSQQCGGGGGLSNVFAIAQMQNNDYQNRMAMSQQGGSMWGGASQLLGPAMMMGMPFGCNNLASAMMMMQLMQGCMGRQAPPCYCPPQCYQPSYPPYANPSTGLPGFPVSTPGGTFSTNQGFGPRVDGVRDHGASARYPGYARLREFADRNGSRDGTFITGNSSLEQDTRNLNRLTALTERATDDTIDKIRQASPRERELMRQEECKMQAQLRQFESRGIHISGGDKQLMQADYTDQLWKKGLINDDLGKQNSALREMLVMGNRAEANMFLKFGERPPAEMNRTWISESPFNANRQLPPQLLRTAA